ncbi:MAG TPA: antitoxin Xre/MbcA/ParS toxin-binding domain-containing protein [Terriglobales bacterium]|nr:antitoxin Xre/MbcA/ParS toxin-binding domain-containing protein [Terriglobales bacterium]
MRHTNPASSQHWPARALGVKAESSGELIRQLGHGFSFDAMRALEARSGIRLAEIASLIGLPPRTFARRKASGRLTSDESEKLLRISAVFEQAVDLFEGDRTGALKWLTTPKKALESETPLEYSRTELGAREVENMLGRLEHGVFS